MWKAREVLWLDFCSKLDNYLPIQLQEYKLTPKWIKCTEAIKSTGAEMMQATRILTPSLLSWNEWQKDV